MIWQIYLAALAAGSAYFIYKIYEDSSYNDAADPASDGGHFRGTPKGLWGQLQASSRGDENPFSRRSTTGAINDNAVVFVRAADPED